MSYLVKWYSPHQFALIRTLLGLYLSIYFVRLFPYLGELFTTDGMIPDMSMNMTADHIPQIVYVFANELVLQILMIVLVVLSGMLMLGVYRQLAALGIWFGWFILLNLNNTASDPSLPFIGLLLLAFAIIGAGEPRFQRSFENTWFMPALLYWGLWGVWTLGFTLSGIEKLNGDLWRGGMAVYYFQAGTVGIDAFFSPVLLALLGVIGPVVTWAALYSQLFAFPAVVFRETRILFWCITTCLFTGSLFVMNVTDVLLGMLLFYFFMFDSTWFRRSYKDATVYIDAACVHCTRFAQFLRTEDYGTRITVLPFTDPSLKQYLTDAEISAMTEMVYVEDGAVHKGADAIIHSVTGLGGLWVVLWLGYLIPKTLRTKLYGVIARNRYLFQTSSHAKTCAVAE